MSADLSDEVGDYSPYSEIYEESDSDCEELTNRVNDMSITHMNNQTEEPQPWRDGDDEKTEPIARHNKEAEIKYKWQWNAGSSWKDYSVTDSQVMESQFGNIDTIQLQMGNRSYTIDFKQRVQINTMTNGQRDIQRVPIQSQSQPQKKSMWNARTKKSHHQQKPHHHIYKHKQPQQPPKRTTPPARINCIWQFANRDRMVDDIQFYDFEDKEAAYLESRYNSRKNGIFDIKVRGSTYSINLNAMTQSNRNTGRIRIIRRIPLGNDNANTQPSFPPSTHHSAPVTARHKDNDDAKVHQHFQPQSASYNPYQTQTQNTASVPHKWQWFDGNGFVDYDPKQSVDMEVLYNDGMNQYRFKYAGTGYTVKFHEMKQYNDNMHTHRDIRRVPRALQAPTANEQGPRQKWQWFDGKNFVDYGKKISIDIENAYRNNKHKMTFKAPNNDTNYKIDFKTLKQINMKSKTERAVRRADMKTKSYKPQKPKPRQRTKQGWPDPKHWQGPKATHKRKVFGKKIMTLYHITDPNAANSIFSDHKMKRGGGGMFGGGIYFAESVSDAKYKALHHGNLITAKVFVGKEHTVQDASGGHFTFRKLQSMGYDSVYAPNGSGGGNPERVIYNFDQVCVVSKKK
eukprot:35233_1